MAKKTQSTVSPQDVLAILHGNPDGLRIGALEELLLVSRRQRNEVKDALDTLMEKGVLERTKGGKYRVAVRDDATKVSAEKPAAAAVPDGIAGLLRVTPGGVGFVTREDGGSDVFIGGEELADAMDMDRVLLSVWKGHRGDEGRVIAVTSRGRKKLTGVVTVAKNKVRIVSDDPRILHNISLVEPVPAETHGQVVLCRIEKYPQYKQGAITVAFEKALGAPGILTTEVEKTIVVSGIEDEFPPEVLAEMNAVPGSVLPVERENRTDFRNIPLITIDPEDARDFDDAVHLAVTPRGYRLHVAIADVSHYVVNGTAVDAEARKRGLSLYLPDRAIPMLPGALSSEMCSLKPDVERLALVAVMDFSSQGQRLEYTLHPGIIRSHGRLSYKEVATVLEKRTDHSFADQISLLETFSGIMHEMRMARGSLELDLPEAKVLLDEDDPLRIRDIVQSKPDPFIKKAYSLVEECMLAANETVGHFMETKGIPVPWRIHEEPDSERLESFGNFASVMGIDMGSLLNHKGPLNLAFKKLSEHEASRTLFYGLLRSMKQAHYNAENLGHYALAATTYLHFTSPIRRYPDLAVHRALKAAWGLEGRIPGGEKRHELPGMDEAREVSAFSTMFERRAVEVERKVTDIYRAWFMVPKIGQMYVGTVISVTNFGLFISIDHPFVEGMMRLEWMEEDHFEFIEEIGVLRGVKSGAFIFPGDKLPIVVAKADVPRGQLSFEPDGSVLDHLPHRAKMEQYQRTATGKSTGDRQERSPAGRGRQEKAPAGRGRQEKAPAGRGRQKSSRGTHSESRHPGKSGGKKPSPKGGARKKR
ncbi:VacB/RNase II family 3'-5' exoribonuclease [Myxococcota bacterium]|nr:VacB/RNase II family 3'-5' exoribonuclease [Myxococcota bacterium]